MADVFVSYVTEDRPLAERIANGLAGAGLSVWWDRHIHGGVDFGAEIERQLEASKAVVVLWSATSRDSQWVRDEASSARDANKLIPIRTDRAMPPLGFRQVQSLDFERWNGDVRSAAFESLLASIRNSMRDAGHATDGRPTTEGTPNARPGVKGRWKRAYWIAAAIAFVATIAVLIAITMRHGVPTLSSEVGNGRIAVGPFEPVTKSDELERVAKGMTDTIVRVFATSNVKAVVRSELDEAGDTRTSAPAEFALRGTVDRDGDRFVVAADVLHQRERLVLWSTTMHRDAVHLRVLQDEFAASVANAMRCALHLRSDSRGDPSTDLFGRFLGICAAFVDGRLDQTPELARRIVEVAPQYAVGYALRAMANALVSNPDVSGTRKPPEEMARLRETVYRDARKAEDMDPAVDSYFARAMVVDPSVGLAERERLLQKSIEVFPDGPARYQYAQLLQSTGRIREALDNFERAVSTNPSDWNSALISAHVAGWTGNLELGRKRFDDLRERHADPLIDWLQFWAELWFGDAAIAKKISEDPRVFFWHGSHKATVAFNDNCSRAFLDARVRNVHLSEADLDAACPDGNPNFYAYFGYVDAALRQWEAEIPFQGNIFMFMPQNRLLRADPRFMHLAARYGLVDYWLDTDQWPDFCKNEKLLYDCKEAARELRQQQRGAAGEGQPTDS